MPASALKVHEVAAYFQVREQQPLIWIARGDLEAIDISSRPGLGKPRWRILPSAIADFEIARTAKTPAKKERRVKKKKDPAITEYF